MVTQTQVIFETPFIVAYKFEYDYNRKGVLKPVGYLSKRKLLAYELALTDRDGDNTIGLLLDRRQQDRLMLNMQKLLHCEFQLIGFIRVKFEDNEPKVGIFSLANFGIF